MMADRNRGGNLMFAICEKSGLARQVVPGTVSQIESRQVDGHCGNRRPVHKERLKALTPNET
jgi:hypothetical protein